MSLQGLLWLLPITSLLLALILIGIEAASMLKRVDSNAAMAAEAAKAGPARTPIARVPALSCGVIDRGSDQRPFFSSGRYVGIARTAGTLRGRLAYLHPVRMTRANTWGGARRMRIPVA